MHISAEGIVLGGGGAIGPVAWQGLRNKKRLKTGQRLSSLQHF
jgi:hypothetical protein